jgi:hypothetical protein
LPNGNLEFDFCLTSVAPDGSTISEVTNEFNPQLVWQMSISGEFAHRAFRLPSLYPGVQW